MNSNELAVRIILAVLLVIFGMILLFIFTRALWLWYFKIEARLKEQRKTNELLQNILKELSNSSHNTATAAKLETTSEQNKAKKEDTL